MKKRTISTLIAASLLALSSLFVAPSANAVNCNAFNQGTFTAAHLKGASGNGLGMIAYYCHGFGG